MAHCEQCKKEFGNQDHLQMDCYDWAKLCAICRNHKNLKTHSIEVLRKIEALKYFNLILELRRLLWRI